MMKKTIFVSLMAALLLSAVSVTGSAYAQSANPECPDDCPVHDEVLALFSEKLDMTTEELQTRLDAGETMSQIALSAGMSFDEFRELMPRGAYGQKANGLWGQGNRRAGAGSGGPYGAGACLNNPECTQPHFGQQAGGRGAGRAN